jgi:16S rRNA (cytosine1402-N4)-methyltransferase
MLINDDFKNIAGRLKQKGLRDINGVLLDLGVSSPQLDEAGRGFSFRSEGPLDMRMNPLEGPTAKDIVNAATEEELADIIWKYGEERFSRRIARHIVCERARHPIETTLELEAVVFGAVPGGYRHGRIHPATRTFQALRIAVNGEIDSLQEFLAGAFLDCLAQGGRVVIISFHSLEDRLVKNSFKEYASKEWGRIVTKKPLTASDDEIERNPRSRSAKLRVFEKRAEAVL